MILYRNMRRPRHFPKGRLNSEGSGGGVWGRGAALSGNQGGWPGSWRCQEGTWSTFFLAARTPASWGLCRGRIQLQGSELDRELSRESKAKGLLWGRRMHSRVSYTWQARA